MSLGVTIMKPITILWRNLISMDVEESIRANPLDGVVLLNGCDKTTPSQNELIWQLFVAWNLLGITVLRLISTLMGKLVSRNKMGRAFNPLISPASSYPT